MKNMCVNTWYHTPCLSFASTNNPRFNESSHTVSALTTGTTSASSTSIGVFASPLLAVPNNCVFVLNSAILSSSKPRISIVPVLHFKRAIIYSAILIQTICQTDLDLILFSHDFIHDSKFPDIGGVENINAVIYNQRIFPAWKRGILSLWRFRLK